LNIDCKSNKEFCFTGCFEDLSKFYFRQQTLQFLFNSRKLNDDTDEYKEDNRGFDLDTLNFDNEEAFEIRKFNIKLLKTGMKNLIKQMEKYQLEKFILIENNVESKGEDKFIKNLCLDIAICYKTLGTSLGHMYSCSRQTSQGAQRFHSVRTPVSKNRSPSSNTNRTPSSNNNVDSDDECIFTGLQTPRKNKNYKIPSFDSFDHLLNYEKDNSDNNDVEEDIINKYIDNELDLSDSDIELDSPHYCSDSLINTIRTVSDKSTF
jgi:hypothetical protein